MNHPLVIIAAGEGRRLGGENAIPKPLTMLRDKSLAEHVLAPFLAAGVDRVGIVTGYQNAAVKTHYSAIAARLGFHAAFTEAVGWKKGNGVSALASAVLFPGEKFLLSMADHIFASEMVRRVDEASLAGDEVLLAVDYNTSSISDLDDLMKVIVEKEHVLSIGKRLLNYNAGDTGLFLCGSALFEGLSEAQAGGEFGLADGIRVLAKKRKVRALDITGSKWMDVDTPESMREAEAVLEKA